MSDMHTFDAFLESEGFDPIATESTEHPDFYALAERLWCQLDRYKEALERITCCPKSYGADMLDIARAALRPEGGGPIYPCSPCDEGPASRTNQPME